MLMINGIKVNNEAVLYSRYYRREETEVTIRITAQWDYQNAAWAILGK